MNVVRHKGWDVRHWIGMLHSEPTYVEAVEDHSDQQNDRTNQKSFGALPYLLEREQNQGNDRTDHDLSPEQNAHPAAVEKIL